VSKWVSERARDQIIIYEFGVLTYVIIDTRSWWHARGTDPNEASNIVITSKYQRSMPFEIPLFDENCDDDVGEKMNVTNIPG